MSQILVRTHRRATLAVLTPRKQEVMQLMGGGKARPTGQSPPSCTSRSALPEKRIASIFTKLDLTPDDSENRRVLAVLRYLES
ncbi:response regulator transcription factor [Mycolicibacterium aubagnense]